MKTYLDIPYEDRIKAKSIGAKFDMSRKKWYVPDGVDLSEFTKHDWIPQLRNTHLSPKVEKVLRRKV